MTAIIDATMIELRQINADLRRQLDQRGTELGEQKERYDLVSQAVAEGIYEWDIERDTLRVSTRLIEIFGFKDCELTAADWNTLVHPDDFPGYRAALRACFRGIASRLDCEYRRPTQRRFVPVDRGSRCPGAQRGGTGCSDGRSHR
jgi:PAS domain-containing protein